MCPKRLYTVCRETVVLVAEELLKRQIILANPSLRIHPSINITVPVLIRRCNSGVTCAVASTLINIILESLPKPGDDTLGDSKFIGYFQLDGDRFNSCQVIYSQFGLAIHQNDHQARHRFVEWAQNEIAVVPDFHKRILFSDEAHFWLNGYVNKQNCRIWSEANPQVYVETPLHPEKLTVWCALWAGGIIGPYFFKNDEGHNVTGNDGATCHTAHATIDLLKDTFGDRLISRFGPVNWPPRSCDLTPLDYFLWGYVKSLVYADKPQTLDHLEDNIRRVIADIRPQMLEKVIEN
ncbi:putative DD41D transposase [Trichonephila clavipes]|nr:putative DD41D transposase [Trichonephila clavipes]